MVQIRSTHVDKGVQREGGWLQAVGRANVRDSLNQTASALLTRAQTPTGSKSGGKLPPVANSEPLSGTPPWLTKGKEMVEILAELNLDK